MRKATLDTPDPPLSLASLFLPYISACSSRAGSMIFSKGLLLRLGTINMIPSSPAALVHAISPSAWPIPHMATAER